MTIKKTIQVKSIIFAALLLFFTCLCSCLSHNTAGKKQPYTYITNKVIYYLLPPTGIEKPMNMSQLISASFQNQDYYFNAWVQADETGMEMTLLNELGVNMGVLAYRDGLIYLSSPVISNVLNPEYIIADFQLCFYDSNLLRSAFENDGLVFETNETGRLLIDGEDIIIEIIKTKSAVKLTNFLRGYSYTLEGDFQ